MEPFNSPKVFVNSNIPSPDLKKDNEKWVILAVALIVIFAIPTAIFIRNHQRKAPPKTAISQQNQGKAVQILAKHPNLFYANLELDPKTNIVTLRKTGKTNGDRPNFSAQPPASSSADFIYKVEVISDKNEVLQKGWDSVAKEVITTPKGIYRFTLITIYQQNASVRLSLPTGQIIWTGKIQ